MSDDLIPDTPEYDAAMIKLAEERLGEPTSSAPKTIKASSNDQLPVEASTSILATARNSGGGKPTLDEHGKLSPNNLITHPVYGEMDLATAEAMKILGRDGNGAYIELAQSPEDSASTDEDSPEIYNLSPQAETLISETVAELGGSEVMNIVTQFINNTTVDIETGELVRTSLKFSNGIPEETATRMSENLESILPELQQQATDYVLGHGITESEYQDFVDWLWNGGDYSQSVRSEAIIRQLDNKDMSGYDKVIKQFRETGRYYQKRKSGVLGN